MSELVISYFFDMAGTKIKLLKIMHPRLQGAISLNRRGRDWGFEGQYSDKGASDPKSEEEKWCRRTLKNILKLE